MDIKNTLIMLADAVSIGSVSDAADLAEKEFSKYASVLRVGNLGIIAEIKGESDYKLMLEAHIDEIGFIVTDVDENGFLTVSACGGFDLRMLPARPVIIHAKEKIEGVFCSTPPHLKESEVTFDKISDLKIDSFLGKRAKDIISVGDYVTFKGGANELSGNKLCGKSFDDRAGVTVLLELARRFKDKKPPVSLVFCLSDMEEIGLRGAKTSTYKISPDEAIAIDVSFADGPDINPDDCGTMGKGVMIGVSPIIDRTISNRLISLAKENNINYQTEVMARSTGTDADIISVNQEGVKTGLVSIPLRNMHTDCEIISTDDIISVCDLLEKYIMGGGING